MYNEIAKVYSSFEVSKVSAVIDKYAEPLTRVRELFLKLVNYIAHNTGQQLRISKASTGFIVP